MSSLARGPVASGIRSKATKAFLNNSWYCAAWAHDLTDTPIGRTMLDVYIVLYRGANAKPVALTGRCPHRFAPLDRGTVTGDVIACPYHGLRFASDGACVLNPNGDGFIPSGARLKSYLTLERDGVIWVWLGDPKLADEMLLPRASFLASSSYSVKQFYFKVRANYQLVVDNLLDLTHSSFIHANTLATVAPSAGRPGQLVHTCVTEGNVVHSDYHVSSVPPSPLMESLFPEPVGERSTRMTWSPASNLTLDTSMRSLDASKNEELHMPSVHFLVPETQYSTHYFAAIGRNAKLDDRSEDERMIDIVRKAFVEEDEPMLTACQQMMRTPDLTSLHPVSLRTDVAAMRARRILSDLLGAERK